MACSAVACALRVGRSRNECRNSASGDFTSESTSFAHNCKYSLAIAYGRETSVASLFGCCERRAIRLRKAERTGSLVSTESDEPTPRQGRYGGGGTNGVYEKLFVHTALADVSPALWSFGCVVKEFYFNVTA